MVIQPIQAVGLSARSGVSVCIYLKVDPTPVQALALQEEVKQKPYVAHVQYRNKEEALVEFRKALGERAIILEGLERNNPLPASLVISFKELEGVEKFYIPFAEEFSQNSQVEHIEYSRSLVDRLSSFLKYFGWIGLISIIFMLVVTGFIITNTIKLALYSHREEIEIMSLVGATDPFIRAPYMIEGFFQGLLGGLVAIIISYMFFLFMHQFLMDNEILRFLIPSFSFISFRSVLLVIFSGITVGCLGSFLAVKGFLKRDF